MTSAPTRRIILDCDPGLDDAIALVLAFEHLDLVGISTVGGNVGVEATTRNALALCDLLGSPETPVHAGHDMPMSGSLEHRAMEYHGPHGTGSVEFDAPSRPPSSQAAVEWLIETIRGEEGLTLVATGPLTNVAYALEAAPDLAGRVAELSWMGGSSTVGNTNAVAEFNAWVDPEAADIVFRAGIRELTMLGLHVTHTVTLDRPWIDQLRSELVDTTNEVFADLLDYYEAAQRTETTLAGAAIHDALAVVRISHPHLLAGLPRPVEVALAAGPTRGMTVVDQRPSRVPDRPNALVIDWADADAVRHLIRNALVGQGERSPTRTA